MKESPYFEIDHHGGISIRLDENRNIVFSTQRIFLSYNPTKSKDGSRYLALELCPNCSLRNYCKTIGINKNIEVVIPARELRYSMRSACEVVKEPTILNAATILAFNK